MMAAWRQWAPQHAELPSVDVSPLRQRCLRLCLDVESGAFSAETYRLLGSIPWPRFFDIEQMQSLVLAEGRAWRKFEGEWRERNTR